MVLRQLGAPLAYPAGPFPVPSFTLVFDICLPSVTINHQGQLCTHTPGCEMPRCTRSVPRAFLEAGPPAYCVQLWEHPFWNARQRHPGKPAACLPNPISSSPFQTTPSPLIMGIGRLLTSTHPEKIKEQSPNSLQRTRHRQPQAGWRGALQTGGCAFFIITRTRRAPFRKLKLHTHRPESITDTQ